MSLSFPFVFVLLCLLRSPFSPLSLPPPPSKSRPTLRRELSVRSSVHRLIIAISSFSPPLCSSVFDRHRQRPYSTWLICLEFTLRWITSQLTDLPWSRRLSVKNVKNMKTAVDCVEETGRRVSSWYNVYQPNKLPVSIKRRWMFNTIIFNHLNALCCSQAENFNEEQIAGEISTFVAPFSSCYPLYYVGLYCD